MINFYSRAGLRVGGFLAGGLVTAAGRAAPVLLGAGVTLRACWALANAKTLTKARRTTMDILILSKRKKTILIHT